ncbi:MAG: gamma-glutamylcyclotransferase [Saprospiraceae bacterium]|nr:gamma-glutamylcyclotransferase [Saprospiraceae bacterium]
MKLFVYGTLMRGMPFPMAAFLEEHAEFVCDGWLNGRLYELGGYPGLVIFPEGGSNRVTGHVFEMADSDVVLTKLDAYEMIDPVEPEKSEYLRVQMPVNTGLGILDCAVYVYNQSVEGLTEIPEGDWRAWFYSRESPVDPGRFRVGVFEKGKGNT